MSITTESMEKLPEDQKEQIMRFIEKSQLKDSLRMYNNVVELCYKDCVNSFKQSKLERKEERCIENCAEKYMKASTKISMRFQQLTADTDQPAFHRVQQILYEKSEKKQ
eukprot:TRINITY_DN5263_c0_g1_i10.p7 TRINITY_DN5263_c0_g1~~TRINITY_DN5263_c0_g1_i10.p7  ORF type:complete len:109 (-),score=11.63 TRINITY_DN5263_c0_g1_i10:1670-1996(-)